MPRRATISLKREVAIIARRVLQDHDKLVYVLTADCRIPYSTGRSRIAYIGTTQNGGSRIAESVAHRAYDILGMHGVYEFEARILTCKPRKHVKTWVKLERALLLEFREIFGEVPRCNTHGKGIAESNEFDLFSRQRVRRVIEDLS
jgi:hypothetical protein